MMQKKRIALAGFALESVSFLPVLTEKKDFDQAVCRGQEMLKILRGTETVGGGFLDILEKEGVDPVPLLYVDCPAGGPASDEAFDIYCKEICDRLERERTIIDGILLYLHGAMTTISRTDPDSDMLRAIRRVVGPELPLYVAFDLHANLSLDTRELCSGFCGFHYSPHTDMAETGRRTARLLLGELSGDLRPALAMKKVPLVLPSLFTATGVAPLSDLVAWGLEKEQEEGVLDISLFCGFAYADVPELGVSVVVITNEDLKKAEAISAELEKKILAVADALFHAEAITSRQHAFQQAVRARKEFGKPVTLLEHADRFNDSTWLLHEALKAKGELKIFVPYLWDPEAVKKCSALSAGMNLSLDVGGWTSEKAGGPVSVEAEILWVGRKNYIGTGPMRRGRPIELGEVAMLKIQNVVVILTSLSVTAIDEDCFLQFGLSLEEFDIIILRSKTHFRAVYEEKTTILMVDTPDWGTANLSTLPYQNIPPAVHERIVFQQAQLIQKA
ncbi:MAG: M81 family metallopeptidase [Sneathiellales bacterium]|nr:M81 family metallopeptidase [Sneathiellales bacterium]